MIFGKGERSCTVCTASEHFSKSVEISAFWQRSYYYLLAYHTKTKTELKPCLFYGVRVYVPF